MTTTRLLILLLALTLVACRDRGETPAAGAQPQPGAAEPAETSSTVDVGQQMPAYSVKLLDGSTFDVAREKGNVLFLNLWATWCGPCRYEIPELEKLHNDHAGQRFKVVGVSVDEGGEEVVREFVEEQKMTYPVALDPEGRLATLFDTTILPTSAIVDRNGKIIWKKYGVVTTTDQEMLQALQQALGG